MARNDVISGVRLELNGFEFSIVNNSAVVRDGFPTYDAMATEDGQPVFTRNFSDAVSYIKAEVYSTTENIKNLRTIRNDGIVKAKLYNPDGSYTRTMTDGRILNGSDDTLGTDGKLTIELKGGRLV